jgi:hypothetical protein
MQAIKPQLIKDEKGKTLGVFLSKAEFEALLEAFSSPPCLRRAAKGHGGS